MRRTAQAGWGDLSASKMPMVSTSYGSREAEVEPMKHRRRRDTVTPPRLLRTMLRIAERKRPSPSRGG